MRGNVIRTVFSHTGKEIVKDADDKCITKAKTAGVITFNLRAGKQECCIKEALTHARKWNNSAA